MSSSPVQLLGLRIAQRNRSASFMASSQLYEEKDQCFQRAKFQQAKKGGKVRKSDRKPQGVLAQIVSDGDVLD